MRIIGVWGWLLLAALLLGICTALFWGVFGTVPTRVAGQGMLIPDSRATRAISSLYGGNLRTITVKPGDTVEEGQIIAYIDQPELEKQLEGATRAVALLAQQRSDVIEFYDGFLSKFSEAAEARRANVRETIALMQERADGLKKIEEGYKSLQSRGLATQLHVEDASDRLAAAEIQVQQAKSELEESFVDDLSTVNARDAAVRDYDARILEIVRQQSELKVSLDLGSVVRSPASGRIATVDAQPSTRLGPGAPVATLAEGSDGLDAVLFVSPLDGKMIAPRMRVDVVPTTIKAEEFGAIVGVVTEIGVAPETRASMMRLLNNETVVAQFSAMGAPFLVRVKLEKDSATPTGFRWTSGTGPSAGLSGQLSFGTLIQAGIVVREQPPIATVVPMVKKWFGLHP
jgi:HlyD family secretion protein